MVAVRRGDGSPRRFDDFAAEVRWPGSWPTVSGAAIGREPPVETRLFAGHRLTIDVTPGGSVAVTPLSP